ncbi:MAG TPA: NAD-dependent dihydropyrimidine dehydrogenase subunit PreA [Candidatus Aminicenantes bacterium]|nr:NAD-dependent dihydropyrimidine dehydrogenase subunit PreA [Candidatus Aminicenantes bacterium]
MDLSVDFAGKHFENPFLLASAPPTADGEMIARAFEAGWAGAVTKTFSREPMRNLQNRLTSGRIGKRVYALENIELVSDRRPEAWFKDVRWLKARFPQKIVIASIMGDAQDSGQWIELALGAQDAGADMLELNFSCPHGCPEQGRGAAIGQNEEFSARICRWLKEARSLTLPLIPKLTAAVSDITVIGQAVADTGVEALAAVNTYPALVGVDLDTLSPLPSIGGQSTYGGMSGPALKPIALRAVSRLAGKPGLPIMATGGVSSGTDAAEFILLGASLVQVCTEVMQRGYGVVTGMARELEEFMTRHHFEHIGDFLGVANRRLTTHAGLDGAFRVRPRIVAERCVGCGICQVSCRDGAHAAIQLTRGMVEVDDDRCLGCALCAQVCPQGAILMEECACAEPLASSERRAGSTAG